MIAISRSTLTEVNRYYPFTQKKPSRVIYYGLSPYYLNYDKHDPSSNQKIIEKYNLPKKYILCVATLQPRKNIPFIIDVMQSFWNQYPHEKDLHLVLVGNKGWLFDDILKKIQSNELKSRIHFTGYIDESELPVLYAYAFLFVYPSLYEGLGLPPLEAMAFYPWIKRYGLKKLYIL